MASQWQMYPSLRKAAPSVFVRLKVRLSSSLAFCRRPVSAMRTCQVYLEGDIFGHHWSGQRVFGPESDRQKAPSGAYRIRSADDWRVLQRALTQNEKNWRRLKADILRRKCVCVLVAEWREKKTRKHIALLKRHGSICTGTSRDEKESFQAGKGRLLPR